MNVVSSKDYRELIENRAARGKAKGPMIGLANSAIPHSNLKRNPKK